MTVSEVIYKLGELEKTREIYGGELELPYQNTIFSVYERSTCRMHATRPGTTTRHIKQLLRKAGAKRVDL